MVIQPFYDSDNIIICDGSKVSTFGEILSDKSIGVFIQTPLIGRIRMSKLKVSTKIMCNRLMVGELFTIIRSQCMDAIFNWGKQLCREETVWIFVLSKRPEPVYALYRLSYRLPNR